MSASSAFGLILAMLVVGKLLAWRRIVPPAAPDALNLVVLYVCLPAAILLYAPRLRFERELLGLLAVPWTLLVASTALTLALARVARLPRAVTAALLLLVPLGNTSFLGFALMPALAGDGALRYAVVYDQFGSFIMLSTFGLITLGLYGGERPSVGAILHIHAWMEDIPSTRINYPCGTIELATGVADLVRQSPDPGHAVIGLRNHGLTITGESLDEIFARIDGKIQRQVPMA